MSNMRADLTTATDEAREAFEAAVRGRAEVQAQLDEAIGLLRRADRVLLQPTAITADVALWLAAYDARAATKKGGSG